MSDRKIEIFSSLCHGEGWITLIDVDYKKVLLELIKGEIRLEDLRIKNVIDTKGVA